MKLFQKRKLPAALLTAATALSLPAPAAFAQGMTLEEVLVTARKRSESLQDAPLAVSVLSAETLRDAGITNLGDITELVPNLQVNRPSRDANIYIRGVGPARGATNVTELSVGVYIDDVFLLKPHGQLMDLAEIESVQVLRGPQGTLFGKNTTGGALVLTTVKPGEEFGGYGQVTVGNDGRLNLQGSIDVPLSDTVLSKLTLTSNEADGIAQDPISGKELSDENRQGALLQVRWLASEDVTADFSAYHTRIDENLLALGDCVPTNANAQIPGNGLITPVTGTDLITDFCNRYSDGVAPYFEDERKFELEASHLAMNVVWEINENHSMKSITAWRTQETPDIDYTNTYSGFPASQNSLKDGESTQFSQEFQFTGELMDGSLRYTSGVFYMDDESDTGLVATWNGVNGIWASSIADGLPPGLVAGLSNYNEQGQENDNTTFAAYTQWSWDATENLELTAGLRYGYEEREISTQRADSLPPWEAYAGVPGALIIPNTTALLPLNVFFDSALSALPLPMGEIQYLNNDEDYDSLTSMFSAAYNFSEDMLPDSINDLLIYASYTEGYKAGGFSNFNTGELVPFEEEEIDSIEIGLKMDAWDNRLRLNVAIFSMDYTDMQLFVARPDPDPNNIGSLQGVTNAGAATIEGAELELTVLPAEGWMVNFSASLADGEFDQFDDFAPDPITGESVALDRSDEDLPSLPESSYNLGVQYSWESGVGSWSARAEATYRDDLYWGFDAATWDTPLARENSYTDALTLYNARISLQVNEQLSIAAWGRNLADKEYYDGGVGETANIGHVIKAYSPPRRYGLDLRYDF